MQLSDYISALEAIRQEHGDIEVVHGDRDTTIHGSSASVWYMRSDRHGMLWMPSIDGESLKGEKVVVV